MRSNITGLRGPAGAGKTKTITNEMIGLSKVGHKIACVAGSNVAVNANVSATWLASSADHPAIRNHLEMIVSEFYIREKDTAKYLQRYDDVNEAYKASKKVDPLRKSNVPVAMTLDYRIWEIVDDRSFLEDDFEFGSSAPSDSQETPIPSDSSFDSENVDLTSEEDSGLSQPKPPNRKSSNVFESSEFHLTTPALAIPLEGRHTTLSSAG